MLLKRLYNRDADGKPTTVRGVRILRLGKKQKFSPELVAVGAKQGWLSMAEGKIILKAENGTAVFNIVRTPGYYCCHCKQEMGGSKEAQAHVAAQHKGKPSPDPENPAGYMRTNAFKGVRQGA